MKYKTVAEYKSEITIVQEALNSTKSKYLRKDYEKYLSRLKKELKRLIHGGNVTERNEMRCKCAEIQK